VHKDPLGPAAPLAGRHLLDPHVPVLLEEPQRRLHLHRGGALAT
jgi:hypothetical protein